MISPKVYDKQIKDLKIEGMEISPNNSDDANILIENLSNIENILERIRYNIRMDIRAIRKTYIKKIKELENSSKRKIKEKKKLIDKRNLEIAPYEEMEYIVDDYLRQINLAKNDITNFLRQQKK
jgi:hypothetical protein